MAIDLPLLCSTILLTPIAIFSTPLLIPTTPSSPFLSLSFFVFAAFAVKMKTFNPKAWKLRESFVQRGYPTSLLDAAFSKGFQIPRSETFSNSVTKVTDHNRTPLVLTLHPFNFKVSDVIRKNFHILKNDPETSSIFSNNPLVSFRHSKNIRETVVDSNLAQELSSPCGTFPCGVGQCKTCKFIDSSTTISAPKFVYHIKHHFTCTSSHLIYCISCSRCGMLYRFR